MQKVAGGNEMDGRLVFLPESAFLRYPFTLFETFWIWGECPSVCTQSVCISA